METDKIQSPTQGATPACGAGAGADTQPHEKDFIEYIASSNVIVNTCKTGNINWILKDCGSIFQDKSFTKEFVHSLRNKVLSLPVRVSLPKPCTELSFPRYYMIFCEFEMDDFKVNRIEEIVGVKADQSPTKWSYCFGYWHPYCQHLIADALEELLSSY
jgi:hypothetical protein